MATEALKVARNTFGKCKQAPSLVSIRVGLRTATCSTLSQSELSIREAYPLPHAGRQGRDGREE